jgi:hypothetical protein
MMTGIIPKHTMSAIAVPEMPPDDPPSRIRRVRWFMAAMVLVAGSPVRGVLGCGSESGNVAVGVYKRVGNVKCSEATADHG